MKLENLTAVVTGGASGLGAAAVAALVSSGVRCLILDIDAERGRSLAASLGPAASFAHVDITDPAQIEQALDTTQAAPLRVLVNCAFIGNSQKLISHNGVPHDLERFRRSIEVNLIGSFNTMRLAASRMSKAEAAPDGERGVIINVASLAAFEGQAGQIAYAAGKGGVVGMMTPAARDLAPHGIRVMTIAPGTFATPAVMGLPPETRQSLAGAALFPARLGVPEEFGRLVVHICENAFLNAEVIRLHAGTVLPAR